jgi:hypothetical protein
VPALPPVGVGTRSESSSLHFWRDSVVTLLCSPDKKGRGIIEIHLNGFSSSLLSLSIPKLSATSPVLKRPACFVQAMRWSTTLFGPISSILSRKARLSKTSFTSARTTAPLAVRKPPPMVSLPALVPSPKYSALPLHLPLRGGLYPCPHHERDRRTLPSLYPPDRVSPLPPTGRCRPAPHRVVTLHASGVTTSGRATSLMNSKTSSASGCGFSRRRAFTRRIIGFCIYGLFRAFGGNG